MKDDFVFMTGLGASRGDSIFRAISLSLCGTVALASLLRLMAIVWIVVNWEPVVKHFDKLSLR